MLLTTIEQLPDIPYVVLGLVRGSTVQCKNFGHDFMAGLKNFVGGEMDEYTALMNEARDIATARMTAQAEELGADAIVGVRYLSSEITAGAAEVLAYGTAVKFR